MDTKFVEARPGDAFLLCSDGLHGYLKEEEIAPHIALGPKVAVEKFIQLANNRGGKDNITAIVVQIT